MKVVLIVMICFLNVFILKAQIKIPTEIETLLQKNTCLVCHRVDKKLVGPSYVEIAKKKKYTPNQIVELIYKPKPENWPGYTVMAAMPQVPKEEALKIAQWISSLKNGKGARN